MATTLKIQKQADIRFRVELKSRPRIVIYQVRSSDDTQTYDVTLVGGKVNNCTCKARKPCYHMHDVQIREDARRQATVAVAMDELAAEQDEGLRFSPWYGSNPSTEVERPIDELSLTPKRTSVRMCLSCRRTYTCWASPDEPDGFCSEKCEKALNTLYGAEVERPIDERGSLNHTQRGFQLMR